MLALYSARNIIASGAFTPSSAVKCTLSGVKNNTKMRIMQILFQEDGRGAAVSS